MEFLNIVLIGDFNQVEFLDEKLGGSSHVQGRHDFMHWRLDNGLIDIPFSGSLFTWNNGRHDNSISFERLIRHMRMILGFGGFKMLLLFINLFYCLIMHL